MGEHDAAFDRLRLRALLARLEEYPCMYEFMEPINAEMRTLCVSDTNSDAQSYFVICVMGAYNSTCFRAQYGEGYCLKINLFEKGATPELVAAYVARIETLLARLNAVDTRALRKAMFPNAVCTR